MSAIENHDNQANHMTTSEQSVDNTTVATSGEWDIGGPGHLNRLPPDATDEQRQLWHELKTMDESIMEPFVDNVAAVDKGQ